MQGSDVTTFTIICLRKVIIRMAYSLSECGDSVSECSDSVSECSESVSECSECLRVQ